MSKTRKCPACGRDIFMYAQVCPYCKAETHFTSIDEKPQQEDIEEEVVPTYEPEDVEEEPSSDKKAEESSSEKKEEEHSSEKRKEEGRLGKYIDHLKKDKDKVKKQYQKKIKSKYSGSTILIASVITILSIIVLALYIAKSSMDQGTFRLANSVDNTMKEVLDSVEGKLILRSTTVVAKFPDKDKHCLYYLQDNHLYIFDAKDKSTNEVNLNELNAKAVVDFKGSGVQNAYCSPNKNYIIIIAARNAANSEFGLYRLGTDPDSPTLEYIDRGAVKQETDGYTVQASGRTAKYDTNGNKVSGMTEAEWESIPKKQVEDNKSKKPTQETKPKKAELPSREAINEEVRRADINIDIDPPSQKPQKPELP